MRFAGIWPVKLLFCKNLQQIGVNHQVAWNNLQIFLKSELYVYLWILRILINQQISVLIHQVSSEN